MNFLTDIFYMYSSLDGSSQILIFLIVLVVLMLVSIGVINLVIKKKNQKYDEEFNFVEKMEKKLKKSKTSLKEKKFDIKEENITLKRENKEDIIDKIEAEEEIEVMEDPQVVEIVSEENSIDKISMLLEDNLKNKEDNSIDLSRYELEEEKDAIISYDELVRRAGAKKIIYKTEKSTISEPKKEEVLEVKSESPSKFKASQIISPIYGIKKQEQRKTNELEEFIDVDNIPLKEETIEDEEMKMDMTFLTNLKAFRGELK